MQNHPKQYTLWLLAAIAAPAAHFAGCGWMTGTAAAVLILALTCIPGEWEKMGKPLAYLQILWLGIAAGTLLRGSSACWPSDNRHAVPLVILVLACITHTAVMPRIGAVVAFCMALTAAPLALAGAGKVEPAWLEPEIRTWPWGLAAVLLMPALPAVGKNHKGRGLGYVGILSLALLFLIQGTLSCGAAAVVSDPLYEAARTLGHLEPVAAVGMTLGWYATACFLLYSAVRIAEGAGIGQRVATVLPAGTAAVAVLVQWQLPYPYLMVLNAFLWVLIPFFQKMKKTKKSA